MRKAPGIRDQAPVGSVPRDKAIVPVEARCELPPAGLASEHPMLTRERVGGSAYDAVIDDTIDGRGPGARAGRSLVRDIAAAGGGS